MDSPEHELREQLCELGRSLFNRGLTAGSSGNLSVQIDDGWLVTPTNTSLGRLDPAQLSRIDATGRLLDGDPPSKELALHAAMYAARGAAQAIVHLHSHWSVAVSMLDDVDPRDVLPALTPYQIMKVGTVPLVPYHRPGDPRVAAAISELATTHAAVLLANHGPVVAASSLSAAVDTIEELEATARLLMTLHGRAIRTLTQPQLDELRVNFGPGAAT